MPEAGLEPARRMRSRDFPAASAFAAGAGLARRSWSGARLHPSLAAVGARRLLSTPSGASRRLGSVSARSRGATRAFAEFDGCHPRRFHRGAQFASSPLCLPVSPLGQVRGPHATKAAEAGCRRRFERTELAKNWRRGPESNWAGRICNPLHNRFATAPRETRLPSASRRRRKGKAATSPS